MSLLKLREYSDKCNNNLTEVGLYPNLSDRIEHIEDFIHALMEHLEAKSPYKSIKSPYDAGWPRK
jgi:hypothetical protein